MAEQFIQPSPLIIGYTIAFILVSMGIGFYAGKYAKTAEQFFGGTKMFGGVPGIYPPFIVETRKKSP